MIEFILGSLFGFGTFFLTVYYGSRDLRENAATMSRMLDRKFKERFGADSDKK